MKIIAAHGYIDHVVDRRKEADIKRRHPEKKARRWIVEVCRGWFNRFRKLLVRYEKLERSFMALNHVRKPGAGRPPKPARQVFAAIVFVLRTGCQWKAWPKGRFGSASAVHKRFLEWEKAGLFEAIWKADLAEYDQMEGMAWRWQAIDGAMFKASLAQEAVAIRLIGGKKGVTPERSLSSHKTTAHRNVFAVHCVKWVS